MKRIAYILVFLLTPLTAYGQSVTLPAEVKTAVGRLASVTIQWDGDSIDWTQPPELDVFREYDPDPQVVKLRVIGYKPGIYQFHAISAKVVDDKARQSGHKTCTVIVGKPPDPGPDPGPDPPTPPDPDVPDTMGLVKASREGLAKVSGAKAEDKAKLASAQRTLSAAIAAGTVTQPAAILVQWRELNKAAVDQTTWAPWGQTVSKALETLYKAGKLPTKDQWRDAFGDIAKGLE